MGDVINMLGEPAGDAPDSIPFDHWYRMVNVYMDVNDVAHMRNGERICILENEIAKLKAILESPKRSWIRRWF